MVSLVPPPPTNAACGRGSDASAFDPRRKRIFSSNGSGSLTVISEDAPDRYTLLAENVTQPLARTMAVDSQTGRVYLLAGDRVEVDPKATNPYKRYAVAPGSVHLLMLDPAPAGNITPARPAGE